MQIKKYLNIRTIIGIAFLYRLFLMRYQYAVFMDEAHYIRMAVAFSQGHWKDIFHPFWTPGYSFFSGLVFIIFKNYEISARILNILLGCLTLLPIWSLAEELFNRKTAVWASLFFALYPSIAYSHTSVMAEPIFVFWGMMGLWLGWRALQGKKSLWMIFVGVCFGFSYLCKPEGFAFFVVYGGILLLLFLFYLLKHKQVRYIIHGLLIIIGFTIVASPYLIYLRQEAGYWTMSGKSAAFQQWHSTFFTPEDDDVFHDLNEDCTSFKNDAILHHGTFLREMQNQGNYVSVDPVILLKKYGTYLFRVLRDGVPSVLTFLGCILFVLGVFNRNFNTHKLPLLGYILVFIGFYWFVVIPMFVVENRYLASMFPLVSIFIGQGMLVLNNWLNEIVKDMFSKEIRWLSIVLIGLLIVILMVIPGFVRLSIHGADATGEWEDAVEVKMAGLWIKEHSILKPPVIMTENKALDFYAGNYRMSSGASFPRDKTDRILKYAKNRKVQYFAITERYMTQHPNLKSWILETPPGLELIKVITGPSGQKVWIFSWNSEQ